MPADFDGFETGLRDELEVIFTEGGPDVTPLQKATEIAAVIRTRLEVWLGTVTVSAGIPVSTTGTATAQTGATTGPGTLV